VPFERRSKTFDTTGKTHDSTTVQESDQAFVNEQRERGAAADG
jgi:hypothetical protein